MSHLISPFMVQRAIRKLSQHGMHLSVDATKAEVAQAIAMVQDKPMPRDAAAISSTIHFFIDPGKRDKQDKPPEYNPWPTMGGVYARIRMDFSYKGIR